MGTQQGRASECLWSAFLKQDWPRYHRELPAVIAGPPGGILEKRSTVRPQIKNFQKYFQIFKLEPINEDILIKADTQVGSNLCVLAILMVTLQQGDHCGTEVSVLWVHILQLDSQTRAPCSTQSQCTG